MLQMIEVLNVITRPRRSLGGKIFKLVYQVAMVYSKRINSSHPLRAHVWGNAEAP